MLSVKIKNISVKTNNESVIILSGVSFIADEGDRLVITGRNGAGKSTLLREIAGLNNNGFITDGEVMYSDQKYNSDGKTDRINKLKPSVIFQDPFSAFDPLKKISYYDRFTQNNKLLKEYLIKLNFNQNGEYKNYYPYELSGGMAQKFQIALNFAMERKVYLMDEPTSALDNISIQLLVDLIKEISSKGKIFVIVTQDVIFSELIGTKFLRIGERND